MRFLLELLAELFRRVPLEAEILQSFPDLGRDELTDVRPLLRWGRR